jgi:DNA-binding GntR family transcriptional regulator
MIRGSIGEFSFLGDFSFCLELSEVSSENFLVIRCRGKNGNGVEDRRNIGRKAPMSEDALNGESIGQKAYRRIRADIIYGRLKPGQKLKLEALKERYETSISTLRELLSRLCSEGLVVAEGQRGFEVASVSAENFREVAAMRLLLECHALERSFAAGDLEWEGRVVAAHHKLVHAERRMIGGDRTEAELWKRYDWEFHHALISACGSRALLETHAAIYDKYLRYQMIAVIFRGEIAAEEHGRLLDCALRRDVAAACALLVAHVDGCVEHALAGGTTEWLCAPLPARSPRSAVVAPSSERWALSLSERHWPS